jgi:hypothetical protein
MAAEREGGGGGDGPQGEAGRKRKRGRKVQLLHVHCRVSKVCFVMDSESESFQAIIWG